MRRRHRIIALIFGFMLSACTPQKTSSTTPPPELPASSMFPVAGACDAETARSVDSWIRGWRAWHQDGEQLPVLRYEPNKFVVREGPRYKGDPIFVRVSLDGLYVDNHVAARPFEPGTSGGRALWRVLGEAQTRRNNPAPLAVVIENDVPASTFVWVTSILSEKEPTLAFAAPPIDEALAVPQSVRDANKHLYDTSRQRLVSSDPAWQDHRCAPLTELAVRFERIHPKNRWPILESEFGAIWVECGCSDAFDMPRFLAGATATYELHPLATMGPRVSADGTVIVVDGQQTWGQTSGQLPSGSVWFELDAGSATP